MNRSASFEPVSSAARIECVRYSMKEARFDRPVNASWCARWWMRASALWRSRMSRMSRTIIMRMRMRMRSPLRSIVRTMNSTWMRWPCLSISTLSYAVSWPEAITAATRAMCSGAMNSSVLRPSNSSSG